MMKRFLSMIWISLLLLSSCSTSSDDLYESNSEIVYTENSVQESGYNIVKENKNYIVYHNLDKKNAYVYRIIADDGTVVLEGESTIYPIQQENDNILRIAIADLSDSYRLYDIANNCLSEQIFYRPIFIQDNIIIMLKRPDSFVVRDAFDPFIYAIYSLPSELAERYNQNIPWEQVASISYNNNIISFAYSLPNMQEEKKAEYLFNESDSAFRHSFGVENLPMVNQTLLDQGYILTDQQPLYQQYINTIPTFMNYYYILYNRSGEAILEGKQKNETFSYLDNYGVIQIATRDQTYRYYDWATETLSEEFQFVLLYKDQLVVYANGYDSLVIQEVFTEKSVEVEIELPAPTGLAPNIFFENVQYEDGILTFSYPVGEDRVMTTFSCDIHL